MSVSEALQAFIVARLQADPTVSAIVGEGVYDSPPEEATYPYVSIGPSDIVEDDAECIDGRVETIQVDCWARRHGEIAAVKPLTDAVWASLRKGEGTLSVGTLVEMRGVLVRTLIDPDGLTAHGVVQVSCTIEEAVTW